MNTTIISIGILSLNAILVFLFIRLVSNVSVLKDSIINESRNKVIFKMELGRISQQEGDKTEALNKYLESLVLLNIHKNNFPNSARADGLERTI